MAIIDTERDIIVIRIVYDGPPFSGKTSSIQSLSKILHKTNRVFSPDEQLEKTCYFDWLDYSGGFFKGYSISCQIITVPGQLSLEQRRHWLLQTADAIIFVIDASEADATIPLAYFKDLQTIISRDQITKIIIQANKQDKVVQLSTDKLMTLFSEASDFFDIKIVESSAQASKGIREAFVLAVRSALETAEILMAQGKMTQGKAEITSGQQLFAHLQHAMMPSNQSHDAHKNDSSQDQKSVPPTILEADFPATEEIPLSDDSISDAEIFGKPTPPVTQVEFSDAADFPVEEQKLLDSEEENALKQAPLIDEEASLPAEDFLPTERPVILEDLTSTPEEIFPIPTLELDDINEEYSTPGLTNEKTNPAMLDNQIDLPSSSNLSAENITAFDEPPLEDEKALSTTKSPFADEPTFLSDEHKLNKGQIIESEKLEKPKSTPELESADGELLFSDEPKKLAFENEEIIDKFPSIEQITPATDEKDEKDEKSEVAFELKEEEFGFEFEDDEIGFEKIEKDKINEPQITTFGNKINQSEIIEPVIEPSSERQKSMLELENEAVELPIINEQALEDSTLKLEDDTIAFEDEISESQLEPENEALKLEDDTIAFEDEISESQLELENEAKESVLVTDEEEKNNEIQLINTETQSAPQEKPVTDSLETSPEIVKEFLVVEPDSSLSDDLDDFNDLSLLTSISQATQTTSPMQPEENSATQPKINRPKSTKTRKYLPKFLDEDTPAQWIWPPIAGRQILEQLFKYALRPKMRDDGSWMIDAQQQWHCVSQPYWLYDDTELARQALRQQITMHLQYSPILSDQRCLAIAAEKNEQRRLWQIIHSEPTLAQLLTTALQSPSAKKIAIETFRCVTLYAEFYLQHTNYPLQLHVTLENIGKNNQGELIYLGEIDPQTDTQPQPTKTTVDTMIKTIFTPPIAQAAPNLQMTQVLKELEKIDGFEQQAWLEILMQLFLEVMGE
jgi:signal recognition particle receptor subunit beta